VDSNLIYRGMSGGAIMRGVFLINLHRNK